MKNQPWLKLRDILQNDSGNSLITILESLLFTPVIIREPVQETEKHALTAFLEEWSEQSPDRPSICFHCLYDSIFGQDKDETEWKVFLVRSAQQKRTLALERCCFLKDNEALCELSDASDFKNGSDTRMCSPVDT